MKLTTSSAFLFLNFASAKALSASTMKYRSSYQNPTCSVCSSVPEAECLSLMKEIVQEMKPRARLQAMSTLIESNSCFGMDDQACTIVTNKAISNLGWDIVTKTLMKDCYSGDVVLSNPTVMRFEFSSLHANNDPRLPAAARSQNSENMITTWRKSCLTCATRAVGESDGDDLCADQLLLTFAGLPDDDRLDIFKGVFHEQSCEKLATSDTACLAVFDTKLSRSDGKDRKAFAFNACAKGLLGNDRTPLAAASPRAVYHDVSVLLSQCATCLANESGSSCTARILEKFSSLSDDLRLSTYQLGLLRPKIVLRLCNSSNVNLSCLDKLDKYLVMVNDNRVRKALNGSPENVSMDTSLLLACVNGILPHEALSAKTSFKAETKHSSAVQAAIDDWNNAKKQTEEQLNASNSALTLCNACATLSDTECLSMLDSTIENMEASILMSLYKDMFKKDEDFSSIRSQYDALTSSTRLLLLNDACASSELRTYFESSLPNTPEHHVMAHIKHFNVVKEKHTPAINAAVNDWKLALMQNEKRLSSLKTINDGACLECASATDKECLAILDAKVVGLSNPVRLIVYKSIFREEALTCMSGHLDADAQCLKALQVLYDTLSDKLRLSGLQDACSAGFLDADFVAPDISTNDVFASNKIKLMNLSNLYASSSTTSNKNAPYFMFAISATMAVVLGFMVSHLVRKRRVKTSMLNDRYKLGPIHEYTALDG